MASDGSGSDSGINVPTSHSLAKSDILFIEPFYGGSHKQLIDLLMAHLSGRCELFSTPDKKWHWKARTSALYFAQIVPSSHSYQYLFASSVLNLAELVALRPDFGCLHKILYFHENQLVYPAQDQKERDYQYGYNQILSALVADVNVFNSQFNLDSFLDSITQFLQKIPSPRPAPTFLPFLRSKCRVMYFPLRLPDSKSIKRATAFSGISKCFLCRKSDMCFCRPSLKIDQDNHPPPLHIVWPHRWEHDKNPDFFVAVLEELFLEGLPFQVSVVGQKYSEVPGEISVALFPDYASTDSSLGVLPSKEKYYQVLTQADVVVSTSLHEFFGVSVLEAVHFGCLPLLPRRLVYPEIYPKIFLYDAEHTFHLTGILRRLCANPEVLRRGRPHLRIGKYLWENLKQSYFELFESRSSDGLL